MTRTNLNKRLERLEARLVPAKTEPLIVNLMYVSPDGTSELAAQYIIPPNLDPVRPWQSVRVLKNESCSVPWG